jgi:hypothetical protein
VEIFFGGRGYQKSKSAYAKYKIKLNFFFKCYFFFHPKLLKKLKVKKKIGTFFGEGVIKKHKRAYAMHKNKKKLKQSLGIFLNLTVEKT